MWSSIKGKQKFITVPACGAESWPGRLTFLPAAAAGAEGMVQLAGAAEPGQVQLLLASSQTRPLGHVSRCGSPLKHQ